MKWTLLLFATTATVYAGFGDVAQLLDARKNPAIREVSDTCTSVYAALAQSTYCATDSPNYVSGSAGISAADQQAIVDRHNYWRRRVSPTATDMLQIYWDEELAKGAEKWARQCYIGHDHQLGMTRKVPKYGIDGANPGQNAAFNSATWEKAVDGWQSEVSVYRYGEDPAVYFNDPDGWMNVAHYTQVVLKDVYRIGCGYAECTNTAYSKFYICNYILGQTSANIITPYTNGTSCSACPNKCNDKLCDCNGLWCFNNGQQDRSTCTCTCGILWKGDTCEEKNCPSEPDPADICESQWPPSYCSMPMVVDKCPRMCGVCP